MVILFCGHVGTVPIHPSAQYHWDLFINDETCHHFPQKSKIEHLNWPGDLERRSKVTIFCGHVRTVTMHAYHEYHSNRIINGETRHLFHKIHIKHQRRILTLWPQKWVKGHNFCCACRCSQTLFLGLRFSKSNHKWAFVRRFHEKLRKTNSYDWPCDLESTLKVIIFCMLLGVGVVHLCANYHLNRSINDKTCHRFRKKSKIQHICWPCDLESRSKVIIFCGHVSTVTMHAYDEYHWNRMINDETCHLFVKSLRTDDDGRRRTDDGRRVTTQPQLTFGQLS